MKQRAGKYTYDFEEDYFVIKMQRGFRAKLDDAVDTGQTVSVEIAITGKDEYDFSCFGLDGNDKLSDDSYFIFFNCIFMYFIEKFQPTNAKGRSERTCHNVLLKNIYLQSYFTIASFNYV